jgi:5'-methylthioadenosine phosphorylase
MAAALVGIIGGSGLYQMEGLSHVVEQQVDTPFGAASDAVVTGQLHGAPVAFIARHGRDHRFLPGEVPYRANIYALKSLGVRYLISVSAVGSLREDIRPLDLVLADQFIDLTQRRANTFFGGGVVAHVSMAHPVCANLTNVLERSFVDASLGDEVRLHRGGTYVCIEGPAFSTYAESQRYRSMGADIIGMTNMPEARLAREAQIAYATLALVTDYDCWHPGQEHVSADLAIGNLRKNVSRAQRVVAAAVRRLFELTPPSQAHTALRSALVTPMERIPAELAERFRPLLQSVDQGATEQVPSVNS